MALVVSRKISREKLCSDPGMLNASAGGQAAGKDIPQPWNYAGPAGAGASHRTQGLRCSITGGQDSAVEGTDVNQTLVIF